MSETIIINEQLTAGAFNAQAIVFDDVYGNDGMIQYKRDRVRRHVEKYLAPASHILELNAGTGEDALYFASRGHTIHATDISQEMLAQLAGKTVGQNTISYELCSYHALESLSKKGPYDHIFSNFAGLNCTGQLDKVLLSLTELVKPGGMITLVLLPRFCLWETLLLFKGKFKTATRRFFAKRGAAANVEGHAFKCWYYDPSYVINCLKASFELLCIEGLCTVVPPSYIANFDKKYPLTFMRLCRMEWFLKEKWPWRSIGDYYMITLKRNHEAIT